MNIFPSKDPSPADLPEGGSGRSRNPGRMVLGSALLFWAALITYLFLGRQDWAILGLRWLTPAGHHILLEPYRALFSRDSWNWGVGMDTWLLIGQGAIGLLAMLLAGRLLAQCFRTYIPRTVNLALSFTLGIGLCGWVFTLLALAGLLYQWLALLLMAMLLIGLWYARHRVRSAQAIRSDRADMGRKQDHAEIAYALQQESKTWIGPSGGLEQLLAAAMRTAIVVITALTFYHALFFPEVYWDSLILYLGYSRDIFLQHAFPVKVVGQVGIGLGANYPHLFEITGATIATWFNHWTPLYLQLTAPIAGLMTIILIYHTTLRLTRSVMIALAAMLMVRSIPYLTTYHVYASSYALVVLFSAAFFYCALRYLEDGLSGYLVLSALCAAFSVQINYLMWSLWIAWCVMVLVAHIQRYGANPLSGRLSPGELVSPSAHGIIAPSYTHIAEWVPLRHFLRSGVFLKTLLAGAVVSSVWYIRNWIVTGNPVYAFFTGLFRRSLRVNPEVMASAAEEWQANGDGIGIAGDALLKRIAFSWMFFVTNFSTSWKWAPVFMGIVVPGIAMFLAVLIGRLVIRRGRALDDGMRFGLVALSFLVILFGYHYTLGPFYLYHLLGAFAVFACFIGFALERVGPRMLRVFCCWALLCALAPGLPWAMMGSKLTGNNALQLLALQNPGMDAGLFMRRRFGMEPNVWDYMNANCLNTAVLTHENRHLLFDPSIRLIHLDDWEIQQVWGKSRSEKLDVLRDLGVRYYLRIPGEDRHRVNGNLGVAEWIADGTLREVFRAGDVVLYSFNDL